MQWRQYHALRLAMAAQRPARFLGACCVKSAAQTPRSQRLAASWW